jgi:opacity protein-like surface antigen
MGIRVNFTDVESTNYDAIPGGTYAAKVTDGEIRESGPNAKNPGANYINWEFTIQEGEHQGRKQWMNTSLLPQALFGLKGLLAATGRFSEDRLNGDLDFEIDEVLGADVKIVVRQKQYEGDTQNEVKRVKPVGAPSEAESSLLP